jgi:hypothetical protein
MNFNFTSQICTTEEQSKRLLALGLKAETADMSYRIHYFDLDGMLLDRIYTLETDPPFNNNRSIPAWSFHRLLELCNVFYIGHRDYDSLINYLENLIKEDCFNKDYLKE